MTKHQLTKLRMTGMGKLSDEVRVYLKRMDGLCEKVGAVGEEHQDQIDETEKLISDHFYLIQKQAVAALRDIKGVKLPVSSGKQKEAREVGKKENGFDTKTRLPRLYQISTRFLERGIKKEEDLKAFLADMCKDGDVRMKELDFFMPVTILLAVIRIGRCEQERKSHTPEHINGYLDQLAFLGEVSFEEVFEQVCEVEKTLQKDPSGVYPDMDRASRASYRQKIAYMAYKAGESETEMAQRVLACCEKEEDSPKNHVGYYLFTDPIEKSEKAKPSPVLYVFLLCAISVALSGILALFCRSISVFFLSLFPLFEIGKILVDWALMRLYPPASIPRMDYHEKGIPAASCTASVTSVLLCSKGDCESAVAKMKENYLRNRDEHLYFVLLADFKASEREKEAEDDFLASLTREKVNALTQKYGDRFFVLIRKRGFSKTESEYMGWERKRGAITEFIRFIKGKEHSFLYKFGSVEKLKKVKYLIALDADTSLLMDSARRMVEAMDHPLNRPVMDEKKGIVTSGYGVMVPSVQTDLKSANKSSFSKIMAGYGGVSTYDAKVSSTYQDVFGTSIFSGKGIVDIAVYDALLDTRFPEGQVLSHDILEGSYLRSALLSDISVSDEYPTTSAAFYKRLERWVRGDTQNALFLGKTLYNEKGEAYENPLSFLSRFQIFDNIRRSLTPALALLALWIGAFTGITKGAGACLWAVAALYVCLPYLISMFEGLFAGGIRSVFIRYFSSTMHFLSMAFYGAALSFAFLPYAAYVGVTAMARSLYRLCFSKKNLLSWVTADQAGRGKQNFLSYTSKMWICFVSGILLMLFAPSFLFILTGLFHVAAPLLAFGLSMKRRKQRPSLSDKEKETLLAYQKAMWRYFEDFAGEDNSFLPADNYQQAPIGRVAYRTSPTNIGFMLLCVLGARDLEFITSEELYERVSRTIGSVEKLSKWHGHLYNWYDTRNCAALSPEYISSVDSANFCACLVALYEGLGEYEKEAEKMPALRQRVKKILDETDFAPLFDEKKDLFYIGYDMKMGEYAKSHYDLLMSEARLASYFAVAKRQVPKSHWSSLGRAMRSVDGHMGALAWTGTTFEYFMPHILLPIYDNSFLYESLCFALMCQKKQDSPWGYSESAFYSFDQMLNYQYRAFGVRALALKTDLEAERVVSPYSTFLTLGMGVNAQMKNLKELEKCGMYGKYGFYEAMDMSKKRTGGSKAVVKSFMSHHIGMSFLSVMNVLRENIMQKRFLRDDEMRSAEELLKEKVPTPAGLYGAKSSEGSHDKPSLFHTSEDVLSSDPHITDINAHMLTNGEALHVLTDIGVSAFLNNGMSVTRYRRDFLGAPKGVFAFLAYDEGFLPLTLSPVYDEKASYSAVFSEKRATYTAKKDGVSCEMHLVLHEDFSCERMDIKIDAGKKKLQNACLILYTEPVLNSPEDEGAHPAFSNLFMRVKEDKEEGALIFSRKHRGEGGSYFALGGLSAYPGWQALSSREQVFSACEKGGDFTKIAYAPWDKGVLKTPIDPAMCVRVPLSFHKKEEAHVTLFLSLADTAADLKIQMRIAEKKPYADLLSKAKMTVENLKHICFSTDVQLTLARAMLPYIYWSLPARNQALPRTEQMNIGDLWGIKVSGRRPILFLKVGGEDGCIRLLDYLKAFKILRIAGVMADLVIGYEKFKDAHIDYEIEKQIKSLEITHLLDADGGVYLTDLTERGSALENCLRAVSVFEENLDAHERLGEIYRKKERPILHILSSSKGEASRAAIQNTLPVYGGVFENGAFLTDGEKGCVRPPWYHVLTNGTISTALSDNSLGFTFAKNARENKLTTWNNDIVFDNLSERLILSMEEKAYDTTLGSTALFEAGGANYESVCGHVLVKTYVHISNRGNAKVLDITLKSTSKMDEEVRLCYELRPLLGVSEESMDRFVAVEDRHTHLLFQNPLSPNFREGRGVLACDRKDTDYTCDPVSFYTMQWTNRAFASKGAECIAYTAKLYLRAEGEEHVRFVLGYAKEEESASIVKIAKEHEGEKEYRQAVSAWKKAVSPIKINTPDQMMNTYFNDFALYQSAASRFFARTGYYQCGGAYGFRDQLQDATALVYAFPKVVKEHLIASASHQFFAGDVLHWWHPFMESGGTDKGVRTKYSDDLLFLPYALSHYIRVTKDIALLHKSVPYLEGEELSDEERERYFAPAVSEREETMYLHAVRAIERAKHFGDHGLCLMMGGDWNDGMNRIGVEGQGESVWLSLFFAHVLDQFAPVCEMMNEENRAEEYKVLAEALRQAVEESCYEDDRYIRAYWDDGEKLGKKDGEACQIDAIVQGFAAIEKLDEGRVHKALDEAVKELFDQEHLLCRLFAPAFSSPKKYPGYIADYPPGIRENGGQYTHGVLWLALGMIKAGRIDDGMQILRFANPICHTLNKEDAMRYKTEPYYMAADIYDNPEHKGRGGWTLYTGAAAWYYRIVAETLLGLQKEGNILSFSPNLPDEWKGFEMSCSFEEGDALVTVVKQKANQEGDKGAGVYVDGVKNEDGEILLEKEVCKKVKIIL